MSAARTKRNRVVGHLARVARRRQIVMMNRLRDLAVIDADRMKLRAQLVAAELAVALGEGAGVSLSPYRDEVDRLHGVVADLDRQVDEVRLAAGLPAEGIQPRDVCPMVALHLDEIGLGNINP